MVEDLVAIVDRVVVLTLRVPVESEVDVALKLTLIFRLRPAARVAGSDAPEIVNALLELLNSVIWIAVVPGFSMEISCEAPVPIFTSPKSTEVGVVTTALDALGVNALELEPQPVSPAPRSIEQARNAIAPNLCWRERAIDFECALLSDCSLDIKYEEEVRFLLIRRHLNKVILVLRSADAENPAEPAAGGTCKSCVG